MLVVSVLVMALINPMAEDADLNGTWQLKSADLAGKPLPAEFIKSFKLIVEGDKYRALTGGPEDKGDLKLATEGKLRTIDVIGKEGPNQGKTLGAIYKIEGDKMTCCYDLSGKVRPTEFKSTVENKLFLAVYEREKK